MRAITAITGYIENGQPHKLIERIKFTPPKKQHGARSTAGKRPVELFRPAPCACYIYARG